MLRSVKNLQGYRIEARDGALGSVAEFYFDDERWTIRYLVVDTGKWLPGRRVLISPMSIDRADWPSSKLSLTLTRDQVKNSPPFDTDKPVSRQQEAAYAGYYGYPYYWTGPGLWEAAPYASAVRSEAAAAIRSGIPGESGSQPTGDAHLRSTKEVLGYHIRATDGEIGHVEDFLVEDDSWTIRYLVVDTSNWWFGNKVLVSPDWISSVSWLDREIGVDLSREAVKLSPRYDVAQHINRQWESDYYSHFGRSPYWGDPPPGVANPAIRPAAPNLVSLSQHDELAVSREGSDPRGWTVVTGDDQLVAGRVDDLIVNTAAMKVRYLDIALDPSITTDAATRHVLVPVDVAELLPQHSRVTLEGFDADELRRVPAFLSLPPDPAYDEQFVGVARGGRMARDRSHDRGAADRWSVDRRTDG